MKRIMPEQLALLKKIFFELIVRANIKNTMLKDYQQDGDKFVHIDILIDDSFSFSFTADYQSMSQEVRSNALSIDSGPVVLNRVTQTFYDWLIDEGGKYMVDEFPRMNSPFSLKVQYASKNYLIPWSHIPDGLFEMLQEQ